MAGPAYAGVRLLDDADTSAAEAVRLAHRYRDMFESAVWGIFQTTPEGHYLAANPALARIYGYENTADLLSALTDIGRQLYVDPNRRGEFVRRMHEEGAISGFESEIFRRDGSQIWISESCREVRTPEGRLLYYEGTVEDITRRKLAEEQLLAAKQKAEDASRAKTRFLATVSHELKTPLNAVIGFAELLNVDLSQDPRLARHADYARDVLSAGRHLLMLVDALLDVSRIETGTYALEMENVAFHPVAEACLHELAPIARQTGVTLTSELAPDLPRILADRRAVRRILSNLLSNGLRFTQRGGRVTLKASLRPEGFSITVVDTGIGMDAAAIPVALQPFGQADADLSRRHGGLGLGLPLARSLAELHGGSLDVTSRPGGGTSVTVLLPSERVLA
ncbi:sensor histidine kinase [Arenibaculum pallidiluteum]|uniref:sensor histidine kinase n=1 Tax=Arenibaculum pallidiluteum TaxID=2812559 RepID=UPI001A976320|nr:PAS domain-containing sensor histidine kinase [Arenibaculum pallidiluteum]